MNEKLYRIRVNLSTKEFEIEGDKDFIKEELGNILKEILTKSEQVERVKKEELTNREEELISKPDESKKPYIKEFLEDKKPSNAQEISVVIAYYLKKYEAKEIFTEEELKKYWTASGAKPPKKIWQAVIDAKNRHQWFESETRGKYRISTHGLYFVENELPHEKTK